MNICYTDTCSLVEAKRLTVVFLVFDWDHLKKSDKIGEVFINV